MQKLIFLILGTTLVGCNSGSSNSGSTSNINTIAFNGTNGSYASASPIYSKQNNLYYGATYMKNN